MPHPSEIAPIVQECFNRRDGDGLMRLWVDDFHYEGPGLSFIGKERMHAQEQNLWTAFPDIRSEVSLFAATADRAVLSTRLAGTHRGELRLGRGVSVPPTGRAVDFTLSVHMQFRNGLIAGERVFYDTAAFARQLGLAAR